MIDQNSQFMAILTAVGEAKQANADALGIPWTFAQMGVGDANGTDPIPDRLQVRLINEQRRAPLNQVKIDPKNSNVIIAEQVIPENVGGWWIREIGLYDADGDLVAVANCAPSFKPLLVQGSGKTQVVRINFIVSSATNVTLKIDPSVVLATRQYVDEQILDVLPPTRPAGTYQQVTINERGVVIEGSNPDTLEGYGIGIASKDEAETGTGNTKPMTALRVAQAIVKRIVQATESTLGSAQIATQAMVNAGVNDTAFITAKKVRFGLLFSLQPNGYFFLPTWMGGVGIQWGIAPNVLSGTALFQPLPIAFPNSNLFCLAGGSDSFTGQAYACNATPINQSTIRLAQAYGLPIATRYLVIGY